MQTGVTVMTMPMCTTAYII